MESIRITDTTSVSKCRKVITSAKSYLYRESSSGSGCYELLVLHEVSKKGEESYVLPGGSKEGEESLEETAARELTEETGYCDFQIQHYLGSTTYELDKDVIWIKTDHLFLVKLLSDRRVDQDLVPYESEVIKEILWIDIDRAFLLLTRANNPEHISLIRRLLDM